MSRKIRSLLRILGVVLLIIAGLLFIVGAARPTQSEEHLTEDGFVIQHRIEIPHTTLAVGVAGAVLLAISFISARRPHHNATI